MSKIISIISCKGGVGKTTSAVNISSYIHTQGKRVLAVDLDYQHNLSKHFGIFPGHLKDKPTVYDLFNAAMEITYSIGTLNDGAMRLIKGGKINDRRASQKVSITFHI